MAKSKRKGKVKRKNTAAVKSGNNAVTRDLFVYLGIAAAIVVVGSVLTVFLVPKSDAKEEDIVSVAPATADASKKETAAKEVAEKEAAEKEAAEKEAAEKEAAKKAETAKQAPAVEDKAVAVGKIDENPEGIEYKGKPIFDSEGKILYNGEYVTEEKLLAFAKFERKSVDVVTYDGDSALYARYKGKRNTLGNWKKIGLVYQSIDRNKSVFMTRKELIKYGFGEISTTGEWKKADELLKKGYIKHPKKESYITEKELAAEGYIKYQEEWKTEEELIKSGVVKLKDGTWRNKDELLAQGYYFDKDDGQWYTEAEMHTRGYLEYQGKWDTRGSWLGNSKLAVHGNTVITLARAKELGLKQDEDTKEWMTEDEMYKAKGYKNVDGKWRSPEEVLRLEESQKRAEEAKKKAEEWRQKQEEQREKEQAAQKAYQAAMKLLKSKNPQESNQGKAAMRQFKQKYSGTKFYQANKKQIEKFAK